MSQHTVDRLTQKVAALEAELSSLRGVLEAIAAGLPRFAGDWLAGLWPIDDDGPHPEKQDDTMVQVTGAGNVYLGETNAGWLRTIIEAADRAIPREPAALETRESE